MQEKLMKLVLVAGGPLALVGAPMLAPTAHAQQGAEQQMTDQQAEQRSSRPSKRSSRTEAATSRPRS